MKFILIAILVLAFILAPIIALKPRGRQSRIEKLRLHARAQGANFSMRRLPALKTELQESQPLAVYSIPPEDFLLTLPEWVLRRTSYAHDMNFLGEWNWVNEQRPPEPVQQYLRTHLVEVPASVMALSGGPNGLAFFWTEEGDTQVMTKLIDFIKGLKQSYRTMMSLE